MTFPDNNTASFIASFTEPAVTTGAPLAYYYIEYSEDGAAVVPLAHIPAAPAGGETKTNITVIVPAPVGQTHTYDFTAVAVDVNGTPSPPSNDVKITVNRVAPLAPTNFTIS